MITRIKSIVIIVLVGIVIGLKWQADRKDSKIESLAFKQGKVQSLNKDLKAQIVLSQNEVSVAKRTKENKVEVRSSYLPQEGKVLVCVGKNNSRMFIKTQNKGVCMCLNAGLAYTDAGYAGIGLKIFYCGGWGCEAGLNFNNAKIKPFICMSRNISDMCKILKNTAIGITYDGNIGFRVSVSL
jgi:hypothetical protein